MAPAAVTGTAEAVARLPGRPWTLVGAPLNSSGTPGGEARAPGVLRAAGLAAAVGAEDAGDADSVLDDSVRDAATGLVGFAGLVLATGVLRTTLGPVLREGALPLVLGGDCAILLGIAAALRDHHDPRGERVGLWFLDGHADSYDGRTSPTGEAADTELAIVTGHGPAGLVDLAAPPLVAARDVVLLGHRRGEDDPDIAEELGHLPADLLHLDATTVIAAGPAAVGARAAQHLADRVARAWLHVDLDVLDEDALPAVSYPQPRGWSWQHLAAVMTALITSPALAGLSIADYNPDRDPDQRYAHRVVDLLSTVTRARARGA